jgi:signal transduction histidine kinase
MALARKLNSKKGQAEACNAIGVNYQAASTLDTADQYFQQAYLLNEKIGNKKGLAQNLGNMANSFYLRSDYAKSLDYLFRALKVFEELDDQKGIATQLGNIGSVYQVRKDFANALKYDSLALKKHMASGDRGEMALQLGNIGNVFADLGNLPQAIAHDLAAVRIYEELGNKTGVARNLSNLSLLYSELNDDAKTLDCLLRALKLQQETGDQSGIGTTYINLGEIYLKRSWDSIRINAVPGFPSDKKTCLQRALDFTQKGIAIHTETGNLRALSYAYRLLSRIYAVGGDYEKALAATSKYHQFKDSIFSEENNIRIANLETRRALELKDKQIELDKLAVAKKRNERAFFIAGILLLLWVIGVIFRNYRVQRTLNNLLSNEKKIVELRTEELDHTNQELNSTLDNLRSAQAQLILAEKQKENETIRSRISQDIHDDISSELTRISWVSELAKTKLRKEDFADMPVLLDKITTSSRETVMKLGEIIWTVNPKNDSLGSLLAYMHAHIANFFADTPFLYSIRFPEEGTDIPINPELKRHLYLVMKEALNNAAKYSGAGQVTVSFQLVGSAYSFCIADDGKGIEAGVVHGGGNGLENMRKRMAGVKGVCEITSQPGKGTQVCCKGNLY